MEEIQNKKGEPSNIHSLINVCISNIICSINFGQRYNHDDEKFRTLLDAVNRNLSNENVMFLATILPFVKYIPGDPCRIKKVLENQRLVEEHLRQLVKEHKETYDENIPRDLSTCF